MWLNELWRRWMGQTPRRLWRRCQPSRLQKRLVLETLEDRTLLSGGGVSSTTGLISAINAANAAGGATTITLAAGKIFNFTSTNNSTNGANALPVITGNITIVGNGTLVGTGGDILARTAMPSMPFRLFDVASGGSLTLQNLTLQGGLAQGTGTAAEGGAIYCSGNLKLSGVTVQSNTAQGSNGANGGNGVAGGNGADAFGGGLYVAGGSVSLTNNDILSSNNVKGGNGGNAGNANYSDEFFRLSGGNGGAASGAGLYVAGGSVILSNDTFSRNQAFGGNGGNGGNAGYPGDGGGGGKSWGGGVYVSAAGSLTVANDSFVDNGAYGGYGGNGSNGSNLGNARSGGIGGTGAGAAGGGLEVVIPGGSVTLSKNTFRGNGAFGGLGGNGGKAADAKDGFSGGNGGNGGIGGNGQGGGVSAAVGSIFLVNDTLSGNGVQGGFAGSGGTGGNNGTGILGGTAGGTGGIGGTGGAGQGGGLFVSQGSVTLINDTIASNQAFGGFGGFGGNRSGPGGNGGNGEGGGFAVPAFNVTYSLANTLVDGNNVLLGSGAQGGAGPGLGGADGLNGTATGPDVSGTVLSSDHDLIGDPSGSSGFSTASGDILNVSAAILNPLAQNGGPTETMALLVPTSLPGGVNPAIDAGDNNAVAGIATDQRGYSRTVGSAVDIGAYEFGATPATPALSISGSGSSSTTPSGQITYTLTVTNTSSTAQSNVDVADQLPANTTLVSWTPAAGWSSSAPPVGSSSGSVTAWIGSLAANSSATFTLVVQVTPGTPVHTVIRNTVSFGPFSEASHSGTNSASINTTVLYAPKLHVVDGGTYNGNSFPAAATAAGIDGITPVAGTFSYAYYVGSGTSGTSLGSTPPTDAGTYTVVATFTSSNPDYASGGTAQATFTIIPAPISYTIGNDTQAYGYPANLAADLPSSFSTGINGETLDITYSSSGDTSTAPVGTYAITGVVSNGTGLASNYSVTLTNGMLTVLGPGVTVVGSTLWIVGGTTSNDNVAVIPAGSSSTGSTGVTVAATLNRVRTWTTYSQPFTTLYVFLYGGNDNIFLAPTLTLNAKINAGNGNDNLLLDDGTNTVTLGDGNDNIVAGSGNNTVTAGNGNDNVVLDDGANTVTVGNGNDNILVGNGDNVIVEGDGHDNVTAGNGDNLIVAGLGQHTVQVGNGSNILIDGSVQLTQSGDSLRQVLDDWILYGAQAANVSSIRSRLSVTYNAHYANTLHAGNGLDWFWATNTQDHLNVKKTDLLN